MSLKYPDAVIYRIKCFETLHYYIGSTVDLERRIIQHKQNNTGSKSIINIGNYNFKILEKCPCNIKNEMLPIEQKYIDRYREKYGELVLNNRDAYITDEQSKERHRINAKKWANNNPERVKLNNVKWANNNPEKKRIEIKKWKKNNPEKVKLSSEKRKNSEIIECPCGGRFKKCNKSNHINRTKIHKDYISKINENKI